MRESTQTRNHNDTFSANIHHFLTRDIVDVVVVVAVVVLIGSPEEPSFVDSEDLDLARRSCSLVGSTICWVIFGGWLGRVGNIP